MQVLGRVRRLLSVQEPPDLRPPRPIFKRHSSDATGSFFPDFRVHPGAEDIAPPCSSAMSPSAMDTLSTLREVNSNPPSPDSLPSTVFPRLVISPPLSCDCCHNMNCPGNGETAKPQNGLDASPTEETQNTNFQRTSSTAYCHPTQLGPKAFRWTNLNAHHHLPTRPRGRQFSLQFSRQSSKGSIRSLPSPKGLGRRRRSLARFESQQSPGPTADTLQLPDPDFQGMVETEEDNKVETNNSEEIENPDTQSQSRDKM